MFGGLHTEFAALKTTGRWLQGSGCHDGLTHAGTAKSDTADDYLNAVHIKKTRYAHWVFAATLRIMLK